eukprot:4065554-Lingulodinium_polyedra.AAC.1
MRSRLRRSSWLWSLGCIRRDAHYSKWRVPRARTAHPAQPEERGAACTCGLGALQRLVGVTSPPAADV